MPSQQKKLNWIWQILPENVGQERYASIISKTQYFSPLTGEW